MSEIPTTRDWQDRAYIPEGFIEALETKCDVGLVVAFVPNHTNRAEEVQVTGSRPMLLCLVEGEVIDGVPADQKAVKWWHVVREAKLARRDIVDVIWSGPVEDFSVRCLPDVPQPDNTDLAIRLYSSGPWIKLPTKEKV